MNGIRIKSINTLAPGALLIKEHLGTSDRETVEQIRENPYLQYFLGIKEYQDKPLFDDSITSSSDSPYINLEGFQHSNKSSLTVQDNFGRIIYVVEENYVL